MVCSDNSINFISSSHPLAKEAMNVEQGQQWDIQIQKTRKKGPQSQTPQTTQSRKHRTAANKRTIQRNQQITQSECIKKQHQIC